MPKFFRYLQWTHRLTRSMRLQFAPFHFANFRPYSLAVPHFVRYYTAGEHRILLDVV